MGLFSRKRVAHKLDVSPGRVSQMMTEGQMIPPVEDESGFETGWPETYVEEFAARRTGRRTSRSIYGFPTSSECFKRVGEAVVDGAGKDRYFVQLLQVSTGTVGLFMRLDKVRVRRAPLKSEPVYNHWYSSLNSDDLLKIIPRVVEQLDVDPFDVAWIEVGNLDAMEVVIVSEDSPTESFRRSARPDGGRERFAESVKVQEIGWDILRSKLGAKVPLLDVRTEEAIEAWQRAGRTRGKTTLDASGYYNTAVAASLLAHLAEGMTDSLASDAEKQTSRALKLAVTRLTEDLPWSVSGTEVEDYLSEVHSEDVQLLSRTSHPVFDEFREDIERQRLSEPSVSEAEAQRAVNLLGEMLYRKYGPYGDTPDAALAFALEKAMTSIANPLRSESFGRDVVVPRFYSLRQFQVSENRSAWWAYFKESLRDASYDDGPEIRELREVTKRESSFDRPDGEPSIKVDLDGNYVLVQPLRGYEDRRFTRVFVLVPTANLCRRDLGELQEFDEIVVEPDTQSGPIMLRLGTTMRVMPFGKACSEGFTHGYSGSGPSNVVEAIRNFLEWASGAPMQDGGRARISAQVLGANQGGQLRIDGPEIRQSHYYEESRRTSEDD